MLHFFIFISLLIKITWSAGTDQKTETSPDSPLGISDAIYQKMLGLSSGDWKTKVDAMELTSEKWKSVQAIFSSEHPDMCTGDLSAAIASELTTEDAWILKSRLQIARPLIPNAEICGHSSTRPIITDAETGGHSRTRPFITDAETGGHSNTTQKILVIGSIVLGLIVIGCAVFYFLKRKN